MNRDDRLTHNDDLKLLQRQLVKIVREENQQNISDKWLITYENNVRPLSHAFHDLDLRTKLAVALCLIATERVEVYEMAFHWFQSWEVVGGAYWIVQQECLRHAAIGKLRDNIQKIKDTESGCKAGLADGIDAILTKKTNNTTLAEKIEKLRAEFLSLSNTLFLAVDMEATLEEYASSYPLKEFAQWTMAWGKIMLMKVSERMQETTPTTVSINVKTLMLEKPSEMKQPDDDGAINQKHILSPGSCKSSDRSTDNQESFNRIVQVKSAAQSVGKKFSPNSLTEVAEEKATPGGKSDGNGKSSIVTPPPSSQKVWNDSEESSEFEANLTFAGVMSLFDPTSGGIN